ncbi:MAG: S9 family peptidase [Longimonas sp.]|uniref:S9 family peptidase n=1 Tax=Longimonas sp. TaxID=2039626 RepID=UPI00335B7021
MILKNLRTPMRLMLALVVMGLLSLPAVSTAQGLTPMQQAMLQSVSGTTVDADGNFIAFMRSQPVDPREENASAARHLFVIDTETGEEEALYSESAIGGMTFRPEHGTLTFLTARDDDENGRALYEMDPATGDMERIYAFERSIATYEWAPDGSRIVFTANEELDVPEAELPYEPNLFEENRPNRIAYTVDVTSDASAEPLDIDGTVYIMNWSPSGEQLALTVAPSPEVDDFYMFQSVVIVDPSSGNVTADINNEGKIAQIEWSPNEEQLALRAGHDIHDPIDGRIMVVDAADNATPENIFPEFEGKFEQIAWTGDETIHFIASESVERSFGTIRPDGTQFTRVVDLGGPIMTGFSPTAQGDIAFTAHTPAHPPEVYWLADGNDQPERMTDSNPDLGDVAMGEQRVVSYTARDGQFEIDGLLILPVDYQEGTRVPLITVVHGGPEAHYDNGWLTRYSDPGQMGAAQGFAVFYPNYRGSTGRGIDFIYSSQGDLAGREFDDVVDGVDFLIDEGIADPDRVGVTGGSYGGYATAWMSTYYSERFAAGVMNVGISNNISKWGTSDIPEELYLVHSRTRIWDSWVDNLKRSPIYYVEQANTPLLIAHGEEDTRVHPGQSLELYRHIKVRRPDVPLRLALYPNEGHGYGRSASQMDYTLRMMRWFNTYLHGDADAPVPQGAVSLEDAE